MSSQAMATMLNGSYFTPAYYISPGEVNPHIEQAGQFASKGYLVTPMNYSYALSRVVDPGADAGRIAEWRDNTNPRSIVLSDRVLQSSGEVTSTGVVKPNLRRSVWTTTDGQWRGSAAHGDTTVDFIPTWTVSTRYRVSTASDAALVTNVPDDLFAPAGAADAYQIRE
jgi:hypothetical protein